MSRTLILVFALLITLVLVAPLGAQAAGAEISALATVRGMVFQDMDSNGEYGLYGMGYVEPGMSNVPCLLFVDNAPYGVFGAEDQPLMKATSDAEGYFALKGISVGQYLLQASTPVGFAPTNATVRSINVSGDASGAVLEWSFGMARSNNSMQLLPFRQFLPAMSR